MSSVHPILTCDSKVVGGLEIFPKMALIMFQHSIGMFLPQTRSEEQITNQVKKGYLHGSKVGRG